MKVIKLNYNGTEYKLEYTKRTVRQMEQEGFVVSRIGEMPMTLLPQLFAGAFKKHHPFLKKDVIEDIFECIGNKEKLYETLADMYNEPLDALMEEPEEPKKVNWVIEE